jgi:hypothetical protein
MLAVILNDTTIMKNWNKTGKIKAVILGILALPNLFMPIGVTGQQGLVMILMSLIFGSIATPLIAKFNGVVLGREIIKPTWNDNPFYMKRPLSIFHFGSFFFLTVGLSLILGTVIKFQSLSYFGLTSMSFGLGMLIGIWLTLKLTKLK